MTHYTRRPEVLRAAIPLIRRQKLNITLAQIADAAGVHRTTVTKMFGSVEQILLELASEPLATIRTTRWMRMWPKDALESFIHTLTCADSWHVVLAAHKGLSFDDKPILDILDEIFYAQMRRYVPGVDSTVAKYHLRAIMTLVLEDKFSGDIPGIAISQIRSLRRK